MENIYNAKIKYSFLGFKDEGGGLFMEIGFTTESGDFSTGKMCVSNPWDISNILEVLELFRWEDLPRKYARVKVDGDKVVSVGHPIYNRWWRLTLDE